MLQTSSFPKRHSWLLFFLPVAVCLVLSACDADPAPTPTPGLISDASPETGVAPGQGTVMPSSPGLREEERLQLYARLVADLVAKEAADVVYISPYIGLGERLDEADESNPLPAGLLEAAKSTDGRRDFRVRDFGEVVGPLEDGGKVIDGAVFVTLGPIMAEAQRKGVVAVRASLYRKVGDAEGSIYRYERDDNGDWSLLEVKPEWNDQG